MAGFSRYLQREVLDHVFKVGAYTPPTHIYVALFKSTAEISGTGYARQTCDGWDAATDADPAVVDNTASIAFGSAGSAWGSITHFRISDNLTAATNWLCDGTALTAAKTVNSGDPVSFPAGALDISLD